MPATSSSMRSKSAGDACRTWRPAIRAMMPERLGTQQRRCAVVLPDGAARDEEVVPKFVELRRRPMIS